MASDNDIKPEGDEPQERDVSNPVIDLRTPPPADEDGAEPEEKLSMEDVKRLLEADHNSQPAVGPMDQLTAMEKQHMQEMTFLLASVAERREQIDKDMKRIDQLRGVLSTLSAVKDLLGPKRNA